MRQGSKTFSRPVRRRTKNPPARPTEPAVNPASIELALLVFMSKPSWLECDESRKRLSSLESSIAKHFAASDLEALINAGCDRGTLLRALGLSCGRPVDYLFDNWFTKPGPQTLQALFGLTSREFLALKGSLLKAAAHVDGINRRFEFGVLLTAPHLKLFQGLPNLIRGYISLLDLAGKQLGRGTYSYRNIAKAILTLYVKQQTGGFRDKKVSALLAAANDSDRVDARSHQAWREEQKDLLDRLSPFIPIYTSDSAHAAVCSLLEGKNPRTSLPPPPGSTLERR